MNTVDVDDVVVRRNAGEESAWRACHSKSRVIASPSSRCEREQCARSSEIIVKTTPRYDEVAVSLRAVGSQRSAKGSLIGSRSGLNAMWLPSRLLYLEGFLPPVRPPLAAPISSRNVRHRAPEEPPVPVKTSNSENWAPSSPFRARWQASKDSLVEVS